MVLMLLRKLLTLDSGMYITSLFRVNICQLLFYLQRFSNAVCCRQVNRRRMYFMVTNARHLGLVVLNRWHFTHCSTPLRIPFRPVSSIYFIDTRELIRLRREG